MFDDSQTSQKDDNQLGGVGSTPDPKSGMGSGEISAPSDDSHSAPEPDEVPPASPPQDDSSSDDDDSSSTPSLGGSGDDNSDLGKIKQKALEELSPLVHKLDQSPEEKYKTIMMMIQASDNQDLLTEAYEAAQKISDEKAKAENNGSY